MGWTGLIAAAPNASGEWATTSLAREPDVDLVARELAQAHSAAIVCFVYDSDVGYAVADAADGRSGARIVINETAAREYGMDDDLPLGRSADAAAELAMWANEHGLKQVDPEALRTVLDTDHVFAEEGAAQLFELLGLKWDDDAPAV